ncbi:T9SS type B sorting domain-containing protein [Aestuariivivens insulae]|uniref:T9SS type B sorting domain-containing protein n=1 Tax=Aestuariivivens insulae TaxID=1621988 RepID=UPI001F58FF1D|nr:T9SS type B sorting domain-containing protein [Aestuariivivens insulae]
MKYFHEFLFLIAFLAIPKSINAQLPTDCTNAVIACGNSNINLDVSGVGTQELSGSNTCSSQENNSVWLKVTLVTSGTLGFTLTPNSTAISEDYDFFVFGPNATCGNLGQAIRCSTTNPQAAGQGNNLTGMNSASTDISEGPGADGNSFVKWLDVQAGDTYFIVIDRPIGNSPFSLEWTGTAEFSEAPTDESINAGTPLNLESCDVTLPFNDGFTEFNLEENTSTIKGSQTDIAVTYYESASDANIGINKLKSPYINNKNPQTIYARITNTKTGCFELTDFTLNVNLGPSYTPPTDYELCDNLDDGNDTNGQVVFNLDSKTPELLNGQDPSNFNVFYYFSKAEAESRGTPLPNMYYNSTPFNQQLFVRIEDVLNPDCKSITPLNLIVHLNPEAFNASLLQCDEDGLKDGFTTFNLSEAHDDLVGNLPNHTTFFYLDSNDAASNNTSNALPPIGFNNTENPQTIYVAVVNDDTECFSTTKLVLEVSITDIGNTALYECDDDGIEDGYHTFNLNDAINNLTLGLPNNLNITFFGTLDDALLEQNVLEMSYTNTTPYSQTIYARAENDNACYGISEVLLTVNRLPDIETEALTYYCLNTYPQKTTLNAAVWNDSPSNYTYKWSTGEDTYEIQINDLGTYSVTVTNANGCSKDRTITVEPSNIATFNAHPFEVKDASTNNTVTVFVSGEGTYQYALYDQYNQTIYRDYQDSDRFENVFPGIYTVNVRDIKNNCGTVHQQVSVIGFPKFFTPNNDGVHDTWQIYGISGMFQPNSKILIFDRLGKLIKELDPLGEGWDGSFNGKVMPTDDYWFAVTLQDGRIFKNHFTLKR